ncbi:hypothetical protein [Pseudochelatococcus contaminans]|uniref:Uncharacterized protein involved in exopolysaccharide biosynthesis n=1 Tax=Pseudochelatococcus contaminans TaxID=1538103 RepID=A0A7W5Z145_9HYPH|nr:hypothetical protein [Pseudochelatococcus contaminans]MBB3808135.1 uncharacterized protein involved in exopolysaccharide biosynthesis [Pseudochelatococcus contaminans]
MQQSSGIIDAAPFTGRSGTADLLRSLSVRCATALFTVGAAALIGLGAAALVPERYTATTVLVLADGRGLAPVGDSPSAAGAIIASPGMAREVIARLGSDAASAIAESHWLPGFVRGQNQDSAALAADAFSRSLTVEPRDGAGVLAIGAGAGSAEVAAQAANMAAQVYLERRAAAVTERDRALGAATANVAQARQELAQALDRASTFRADPAATDTARRAQAARDDLSLLIAERTALVGERDAITRRLLSVDNLQGSGNLFEAPFEGVHLLRHLVEQRLTLRAELAAERRIRAARDWRVRALSARAADLDNQIESATGSAREWLASERDRLDERITEVESAIHLHQAILAAATDNDRRQVDLDHAVAVARDRLTLARDWFVAESERVSAGTAAARVITIAEPPLHPDRERPLIVGIVVALLAGLALWRLLDSGLSPRLRPQPAGGVAPAPVASNDDRLQHDSDREVERQADEQAIFPLGGSPSDTETAAASLPTVAGSPLVSVRITDAGDRALELLLAKLAISPRADGGRHLVVTGAENNAASATVARALAQHLSGRERVVLLDLATPDDARPGFADLVAGRASFAEIITREPGSRMHVVARGRTDPDAMSAGDAAALALAALDQTYDWIIELLPAQDRGGLAERLLGKAQGIVLVADGEGVDMQSFSAYEALRERGAANIVVGLSGSE